MACVIWSPELQSGRGHGVLMSLRAPRPANHRSRVCAGCYNQDRKRLCTWEFRRTHNGHAGFRVRAMQFRRNKRSRLQVRASRDVLNAISISRPRGSAVSSRCHAHIATCDVNHCISFWPSFHKTQNSWSGSNDKSRVNIPNRCFTYVILSAGCKYYV